MLDTGIANVHTKHMAKQCSEHFELRQQAHYYKAQHARACERESFWKEKAGQLEDVVRSQKRRINQLSEALEALKAKVAWLTRQLFGNKSEKSPKGDSEEGKEHPGENQEEEAEGGHAEPDAYLSTNPHH